MKNATLKYVALFSLILFSTTTLAQEEIIVSEKYTTNNKGKFFISWGGNRETFSKSDIRFQGEGYDFTIHDASAKDKPKGWHIDYINPTRMTIPQTNVKVGYFISDKYNIAFGVDHMKYVMVADQTVSLLEFFGYSSGAYQHKKELSVKILIEGNYTSRVIEGCNSVSIIILFIAFIIAFAGSLKATIIYVLLGSLFIYIINVVRIAFLSVMIYKYPNQQEFLHNLVFPAIIYGTVFILWVIWVNKFSNYKR